MHTPGTLTCLFPGTFREGVYSLRVLLISSIPLSPLLGQVNLPEASRGCLLFSCALIVPWDTPAAFQQGTSQASLSETFQ